MSKMDEVRKAMMQALKNKEMDRKETLSLLLSALKAKYIDKREDLTEEEENAIILKEIKQTQETMENAPDGRDDILTECKNRLEVLNEFAPKMMDETEIKQVIQSVLDQLGITQPTVKDKGIIMKNLMPLVKGKADGGLVNRLVGEYLK
ncbi:MULTISPECIES: GatB/YqeY domain-containing protein [Clostridiaceae]|uniref:GatB/YqeY domain-containing protein n=1 Tax=Clostridium facile TaxID=2763035 RepID=A0ABR7IRA9_9CLOT|nr:MULTISPECIES: GatB/YqeY domain-containing protein [Clostridiaceae]MBC5787684.1 GatB/YqeY domain-containing protein [Clostridium facile]